MNFGEHFVDLILPRLGVRHEAYHADRNVDAGTPCLMAVGSELHNELVGLLLERGCHVHVWGQGNGRGATRAIDMRKYKQNVTIHALRGPLTKRQIHFDGDVPLCDPGFLLPAYYPRWKVPDDPCDVIYFPHHANCERVTLEDVQRAGADEIANPMVHRDELADLCARVASASFVLTNTLHGFIFCLAYKVPCALCLTGNEVLNMPDKFRDVLESMGWDGAELPIVRNLEEGQRWWEREGSLLSIPDTKAMIEAFPFRDEQP